jgi:sigma-B regulation protein RsbU (phosphoserine phosphatase)
MQETKLNPGSTIFLYTDGLTEAKNEERKQFGMQRVKNALATCAEQKLAPEAILETVTQKVHEFVKDAEQSDDLTLLAIHYTPVHRVAVLDEQLTLQNDVHQIQQLNTFVKQIMERLHVDKSLARELQLAMEEAVVNVMEYAYPVETNGDITIKILSDGNQLKFVIIDAGVYFDPTAKVKTDIDIPVQDRQIGGLGILLVRELMDSINYERTDGKNVLTLIKTLKKQNNKK